MSRIGPGLLLGSLSVALPATGCIAPAGEWEAEGSPDPAQAEVRLSAAEGWDAFLVYASDVGIWTVGTCKAFVQQGCPEVFGLDDRGRCTILSSYSGKWTPFQTVEDRTWLGAFQELDLDPRRPGRELYVGGQAGNLYQILVHRDRTIESQVVARLPAQEIHTAVGGDLLPSRPGAELLIFTALGEVYDLRPADDSGFAFDAVEVANVDARVRQALLLPSVEGEAPRMVAACRSGEVLMLRMTDAGLERRPILREPMGLGRVAMKPGDPGVLYVTRDDGVVLRLERGDGDAWSREPIYAGPQGPRGIAAGRFASDPATETVAVFGYSGKVQLLSRAADASWTVETLFEDVDKGHWLAAAELDGRNGTDELLASGYGARIVLLSRPPGFGLPGVALDPDPR